MNGICKLLGYSAAMIFATLAMPVMAAASPTKVYDLRVCVGTVNVDTTCNITQEQQLGMPTVPTTIQARIYNVSPPNTNSNFNSVDLFVGVHWRATNPTITDNSGKFTIDAVSAPGHILISNLAPVKPGGSVTVTFSVDSFSCGDGTWDANVYTGSGFTGSKFSPTTNYQRPLTTVACVQFACGNSVNGIQPQGDVASTIGTTDPHYIAQLMRGGYDADGTTGSFCTDRFAYVTPTVTTDNNVIIHTTWDVDPNDSVAIFRYIVNVGGDTVMPDGVTLVTSDQRLSTLKVAWLLANGVPDKQPALRCDTGQPDLPTPYTMLIADNGNKITVASSALAPQVPFPIVIEDERLVVTKVNTTTNTWSVTRPTGGTSTPTQPHAAGLPVMSTPFPVVSSSDGYSSGYIGKTAKICINALQIVNGQWQATVIDGSDGFIFGR